MTPWKPARAGLQDLDGPVFQEIPPRRPERAIVTAAEEEAAQQQ